jgi:hypothetical protein
VPKLCRHPPLVRGEDHLPAALGQGDAARSDQEVAGRHLAVVDKVDDDGLGDERAELLGQIQSQCRSAEAGAVVEALIRVEPNGERCGRQLLRQQAIDVSEQAVDRIGWGRRFRPSKLKGLPGRRFSSRSMVGNAPK